MREVNSGKTNLLLFVAVTNKGSTIYTKITAQVQAFENLVESGKILKFNYLEARKLNKFNVFGVGGQFSVATLDTHHYKKVGVLLNILFNYPRLYFALLKYINNHHVDVMYVRKPPVFDIFTIIFLYRTKMLGVKTFFEIPTFPYEKELDKHRLLRWLDKLARPFIKHVVYRVVTFSSDDYINGAKCINISNGVDLNRIRLTYNNERGKRIVFTCVAGLSFWHQIDRFLNAMVVYLNSETIHPKEDIFFNIVGDGDARRELEGVVSRNNCLVNRVRFHGILFGDELDEVFSNTNIGVGNLEETRTRNLTSVQPLKHREYAARGLPFVYGLKDPDFDGRDFVYSLSAGEIDLKSVLQWYKGLKVQPLDIRKSCNSLTWVHQFEKVLGTV